MSDLLLPRLPDFDLHDPVSAFAHAPELPLIRAWEAGAPTGGTVRAGWTSGYVWGLFTVTDADVFNTATADNQNTWETGDVFEIFARHDDSEAYVEAHVTPNNIRLHLRFPDSKTVAHSRAGTIPMSDLHGDPTAICAHASATADGWQGVLGVPLNVMPDAFVRLSFCRYDAHPGGGEPDYFSTSPHTVADFHRLGDWLRFRVVH
jgi:hypothetical protein